MSHTHSPTGGQAHAAVQAGPSIDVAAQFRTAQQRVLDRYGVAANSRFIDVPVIGGGAHVLEAGDGPPLVMVIGGTIPAAMWAPLMAQLSGYRLYAMDLPGFGLTDAIPYEAASYRVTTVRFLAQLLDALGLQRVPFVTNSTGSLWTNWLSLDHPDRVTAQVQIGCPAHVLGTAAPLPMRLVSIRSIGRLLMRMQPPSVEQVERVGHAVREDLAAVPEIRDVLLACERLPTYAESMLALMHAHMRFGQPRREVVQTGADLAAVRHPVQLIWGEDDPFGSVEVARRVTGYLPDAQLDIVPGGHAPWFHHAAQVARLALDFLHARAEAE